LRNRKLALALSLLYCGLGQIYKGEVLKGINFIVVYTLLIVSSITHFSPPLYFIVLPILLMMWLVGMVDAYIDDEMLMGINRSFMWQKLMSALPVLVICAAIVTLLVLWSEIFTGTGENLRADAQKAGTPTAPASENVSIAAKPDPDDPDDAQVGSESTILGQFTIQAAAFRDMEKAEKMYRDLRARKYTVRIERPKPTEEDWYRVLVGEFSDKQEAIVFMEKLRKREGFSNMLVRSASRQPE